MSGKVVGWAFEQKCRSPVAKLILVKLADNANEEGYCWPSVALIVRHTGLSERAVRANLGYLEEDGLIRIETRITAHRGQISNAYQLAVPGSEEASPARGAGGKSSPVQAAPAPHAGGGGTACTPIRTVNEPAENLPLPPKPDGDARAIEARIAALRDKLGEAVFRAWFDDAVFGEKVITLSKRFKADWVARRFSSAIGKIFGEDVAILAANEPSRETPSTCKPGNVALGGKIPPSIQVSPCSDV